jgi:phage terminase large subunit GpA-like protein
MTNAVRQSVAALVFGAIAAGLAPDPVVTVSAWAEQSRQLSVAETPRPGKWDNSQVPYLSEPMDCMSLSEPNREVIFLGSAQVAKTQAGINAFGTIACRTPAPMLTVLPTEGEVNKYVNLKLNPAIEATPELREKVDEQKSRDEKGSTTRLKRFPGGFNQIVGANSSAGLQMVSVRVLLLEEVSEYPFDVDERGDPVDLAIARTKAFTENRKIIYVSTPAIKGSCRITAKYEAGDQRRFYVPCPHCGAFQVLKFE